MENQTLIGSNNYGFETDILAINNRQRGNKTTQFLPSGHIPYNTNRCSLNLTTWSSYFH